MSEELVNLASVLERLNQKWKPHPKQVEIGKALLVDEVTNVFARCGRNFGKTDLAIYLLWRWALLHPNSENYLFEPEQKQAKEILWASGRIQAFGDSEWLDGEPNNTEMRIRLANGSFIKIDGSDNYDSYRGVKPKGLIIYDELKDINPKFLDAFEPNRAAHNAPALWIGTPPEYENHFIHYMQEAETNPRWACFHAPTSSNPFIDPAWLLEKEAYYKRIGDYETWLREYEALFVKGGKSHILPQFMKLDAIKMELPRGISEWQLFVVCDPGTASVFGVLFILFNPYSKQIKVWREIYEDETSKMTTRQIWSRIYPMFRELVDAGVKHYEFIYDEAAAWFANEVREVTSYWFTPTRKSKADKESGIALIRDVLDKGLLEYDESCVKFKWEMENYVKDRNGRIPKVNDHLIDCFRYFLDAAGFSLDATARPKEVDPLLEKRFHRIESDYDVENTEAELWEID
jgi:hypothetical protein